MAYRQELFGKAADGTKVYKYILTNKNGASAAFTDLGGTWLEMKVPDKDGNMEDVLLGWGSAEDILSRGGHMGEIIGRNANRISGAKFELNGKTYNLTPNAGNTGNNIHSGNDFYRDRVWDTEMFEDEDGITISFSLFSPDGDQGFPGDADIEVTYTLTGDNALRLDYYMKAEDDTIANFTNHAYFNLGGHASGNISGHKVWIDADYWTPADETSVPTGELAPVKGTPMDFTILKPIGQDIDADFEALKLAGGYDHNFALNHAAGELSLSARAVDEKSGRVMEVYTDLPGIQFYTANSLKPLLSKDKVNCYGPRGGYCFETQLFPDAVNKPMFQSPVLKAGEEYRTTTIYKFTTL